MHGPNGFSTPYFRVPVADAIECMVPVLGPSIDPILLVSTVDDDGFVGPGDTFSLSSEVPSTEALFQIHRTFEFPSVLFGSRATFSLFEPDECDVQLTRSLLAASNEAGISVVEHVLVKGNAFRLMVESLQNDYLD